METVFLMRLFILFAAICGFVPPGDAGNRAVYDSIPVYDNATGSWVCGNRMGNRSLDNRPSGPSGEGSRMGRDVWEVANRLENNLFLPPRPGRQNQFPPRPTAPPPKIVENRAKKYFVL
ncbi:hypothetical protein AAG570_008205 [Ranatra chinensis]|uniref:Uncharacterized protein n=1 Tax=Ranatra chinensis TaxID=642074 RepID=A0ABD0Y7U8_9HEMI